jgi:hypothetical protein
MNMHAGEALTRRLVRSAHPRRLRGAFRAQRLDGAPTSTATAEV